MIRPDFGPHGPPENRKSDVEFKMQNSQCRRVGEPRLRPFIVTTFVALLAVGVMLGPATAAEPWTLQLELDGKQIQGVPLRWSDSRVILMGRDGEVWRFSPHEATNFRKVPGQFRGYDYSEMRGRMLTEFHQGFELSTTPHYFIAHPPGQADRWTKRFEELYRSFVRYFQVQGIPVTEPTVPLVAVIFPNQAAYLDYAGRTERGVSSQTLGYYSLTSNRIIMFDVNDALGKDERWQTNAATIVHEAVHQAAFNTGVHDRATLPPRWVVEGMGTMFEAEGVWDSQNHPRQVSRLHRDQLLAFKKYREGRKARAEQLLANKQRILGAVQNTRQLSCTMCLSPFRLFKGYGRSAVTCCCCIATTKRWPFPSAALWCSFRTNGWASCDQTRSTCTTPPASMRSRT